MFDVLVYLYENYWRPDACPDHDQLSRKLTAVGFETDEIQEALHWLDGLADTSQGYTGVQSDDAIRLYSDREIESLGETLRGLRHLPRVRPACCPLRCAKWSSTARWPPAATHSTSTT